MVQFLKKLVIIKNFINKPQSTIAVKRIGIQPPSSLTLEHHDYKKQSEGFVTEMKSNFTLDQPKNLKIKNSKATRNHRQKDGLRVNRTAQSQRSNYDFATTHNTVFTQNKKGQKNETKEAKMSNFIGSYPELI